ncbi:PglL family O-oligosaccharyltransferase [Vibrio sp. HN007]|uniref:PglL family O-oligosaccharyltransferase n=1 Tax=Vibrio iocasae TaxID=3098914 RepID=UPI0035D4281D
MAIVHLSGTKLAAQKVKAPLNRQFMYAMGLTFMLAMHFYMPNPGGFGLELPFNSVTWIFLSFALGFGFYQTARNRVFRYTKLTIALLISSIILTLPILYTNASPSGAIERLVALWTGWLLFFVLQQFSLSNRHKQRLLWFIVIAVVIQTVFGYIQYLFPPDLSILGMNPHQSRPYGIFQQPNVMASFLATGLVLSGYLLARQQQKYGQRLSRTTLLYLMPAVTVPLIVVLASRTGWLGASLGTVLVLPYLYKFSTKRRLFGWFTSVIVGIAAGFMLSYSTGNTNQIIEKADLDGVRSITYPQAVDMFIEKPFTGYGYGRFEPEYIVYTARQHQLNPNYFPGVPSMEHPHNELLLWGVEGGLVSLIGIAIAVLFVLAKLMSVRNGTRLAITALFVPIVIHTQLEYPFYHSAIHWIAFIVLLFWLDQRSANYKNYHFSKLTRLSMRLNSLLLPAITTAFMATVLHSNYVLIKFETSSPKNPEILEKLTNKIAWKDRIDWDIYSSYLKLGLVTGEKNLLKPYVDWSSEAIKHKPRIDMYKNLIIAYQGMGQETKAEQIRDEAQYLFPNTDFSNVQLVDDLPQRSEEQNEATPES